MRRAQFPDLFVLVEVRYAEAFAIEPGGVDFQRAARLIERHIRIHDLMTAVHQVLCFSVLGQPVFHNNVGVKSLSSGLKRVAVIPDSQRLSVRVLDVVVDTVDKIHICIARNCGLAPLVLHILRHLREVFVSSPDVFICSHVPVLRGEQLHVLVDQAGVEVECFRRGDIQVALVFLAVPVG